RRHRHRTGAYRGAVASAVVHHQTVVVEHRVAGGHAVHVEVALPGALDHAVLVLAGLRHGTVLIPLEGHQPTRPNIDFVALDVGQVPARIGSLVDDAQLLLGRGAARAVRELRIVDGLVGQPTDGAGVGIDDDGVGRTR